MGDFTVLLKAIFWRSAFIQIKLFIHIYLLLQHIVQEEFIFTQDQLLHVYHTNASDAFKNHRNVTFSLKVNSNSPEIEPSKTSFLMSLYTYLKDLGGRGEPVDRMALSVVRSCVSFGFTPLSSSTASHFAPVPSTVMPKEKSMLCQRNRITARLSTSFVFTFPSSSKVSHCARHQHYDI